MQLYSNNPNYFQSNYIPLKVRTYWEILAKEEKFHCIKYVQMQERGTRCTNHIYLNKIND